MMMMLMRNSWDPTPKYQVVQASLPNSIQSFCSIQKQDQPLLGKIAAGHISKWRRTALMRRQQRQLRDHFHPHHRHPRPPRRARPMTMMTIRIQSAHWHLGCCRTWRTQISVVISRTRVPPLQGAGESASHLEMYLCIQKAG